jgi:hypothetical protein
MKIGNAGFNFVIIEVKKGEPEMDKEFGLNDVVQMKKPHPCGENRWKVIRMGMDIRIKCLGCGHSVMIPRREFTKKIKKVLEKAEE